MKVKSAVVTGVTGVLGRQVLRQLLDSGVSVHAFVRDPTRFPEQAGLVAHQVDLASGNFVIPDGVDTIFHVAQSREFRNFPDAAPRVFEVNVASTAYLVDAAHRAGVDSFVYASTGGVYSVPESGAIRESDAIQSPDKLGVYLGGKLAAESHVLSYSSLMRVAVLRYFFIYGETQESEMLIPRLYRRVLNGETISVDGTNGLTVNPVNSVDAATATIAAAGEAGIFNIAGPEAISLRQMCELFGEHAGRDVAIISSESRASSLVADIGKMRRQLYAPKIRVADSLDVIRHCAE